MGERECSVDRKGMKIRLLEGNLFCRFDIGTIYMFCIIIKCHEIKF